MQSYRTPVNRKKSRSKTPFIIGGLILLAAVLSFFTFRHFNKSDTPVVTTDTSSSTINYDPPTEEEIKTGQETKARNNSDNPTAPVINSAGLAQVTPTIASYDTSSVSAYITGIFEEGGTCTATFKRGDDTITTTSTGFQNSNYTSCAPLKLQSPLNIRGDWTITVSYVSAKSSGTSEPVTLKVN